MIKVLLIGHVTLAVLSLVYAAGVINSSRMHNIKKASARAKTMWRGTLATMGSGVFLAIVTKSSIVPTCTSLFSVLAVILAAHYYQRYTSQKLAREYPYES